MQLQLGLDVIRSYKRLPYDPWIAIAEFVDNSTQSYFNNREVLDKAYATEGSPLEVSVVYDKDGAGLLRVSDNAMGMSHEELTRAMHIGLPPENATGRSRYGLGMKMAACWFGDEWKIVTKKLGSDTEYTIAIDVEQVAAGNADLVESSTNGLPLDSHYTRIEIRALNAKPHGRTLGKIKDFLAGMYRLDIESKALILNWQNTPLDPTIEWKFLEDPLGTPYRKDFTIEVNGKEATGWVGVLDTGGRPKAGFAIAHNGRMIRTWPDAWHPEALYGQTQGSNDLVNQRLVGEINLDAFDVSHTKDAIHWVDDEEDQVQDQLQQICAEYRDVARKARKAQRAAQAAIQAAAKALQAELASAEMSDLIDDDVPSAEAIAADEEALLSETIPEDPAEDFADFVSVFVHQGRNVRVIGKLDTTLSQNDPYAISTAAKDDEVVVVINMNHPHLDTIDDNGLLNYFRHCTYDALSEWRARNQMSTVEPSTIRKFKDGFLRVALDIEMHAGI